MPGQNLYVKSVQGVGLIQVNTNTNTVLISGNAGPVSLTSAGGGVSIVQNGTGPVMGIRSLSSGGTVNLTSNPNGTVVISSNSTDVSLTSTGGGLNLAAKSNGPNLAVVSFSPNTGITLSSNATTINVFGNSNSFALTSVGTGTNMVSDATPPTFSIRGIVGNGSLVVNSNATSITLNTNYALEVPVTATNTDIFVGYRLAGPDIMGLGLPARSDASLIYAINTTSTSNPPGINILIMTTVSVNGTDATYNSTNGNLTVNTRGIYVFQGGTTQANGTNPTFPCQLRIYVNGVAKRANSCLNRRQVVVADYLVCNPGDVITLRYFTTVTLTTIRAYISFARISTWGPL